MANPSNINRIFGNQIAVLTNAITTVETAFSFAAGYNPGSGVAVCAMPANALYDGVPFTVRATGKYTTGTTSNVTPCLYVGTSLTLSSDSAISAMTTFSAVTASGNWIIEAHGVWDSVSTKYNGWYNGIVGTTVKTGTTFTNAQTGIAAITGLSFLVSFTFSSGNAANTATLTELSLEA
jgi:hypothetical protein